MVIFATPDFGAGAFVAGIVMLAGAITLILVAAGFIGGAILLRSRSIIVRRVGWFVLLGSAAVPPLCCVVPPYIIRVEYGNYPIGDYADDKVHEGMSQDEVAAALGTPHERFKVQDGEAWYYWCDSFGIRWSCVRFGADGRVTRTYRD
jgi:SmpA/OmlA family protein